MFQYVYVSSAVVLFRDEELKGLLEVSRRHNGECDITGLLLYVSGNFIQLLEGRKEDVVATRERIAADPRHRGMITLLESTIEKRDFPDWSMGFEKVDGPTASQLPGYNDFLERAEDETAKRSGALKLLAFFREINTNQKKPKPL